ncbi:hypothetical protein [Cylindrospermum sp. FACHB-282]|uniref:hypothetical protein n=1 Tax=Cylindrospermum sp. FACHB-282 TaxID=2692794 RepID=UPI003F8D66CE
MKFYKRLELPGLEQTFNPPPMERAFETYTYSLSLAIFDFQPTTYGEAFKTSNGERNRRSGAFNPPPMERAFETEKRGVSFAGLGSFNPPPMERAFETAPVKLLILTGFYRQFWQM